MLHWLESVRCLIISSLCSESRFVGTKGFLAVVISVRNGLLRVLNINESVTFDVLKYDQV